MKEQNKRDFINKLSELLNEQEMIMEESFNEAANRGKFKQSSEGSGGKTSKEKQENLRNTLGNIMRDIGESENELNAKQTLKVLENQLCSVLEGANIENCIIAYEPVWAIGTGKTPEVNLVNDIHEHIKDVVQSATTNNFLPNVIYGGSLNEGNASSFFGQTHIDGSLVGGASLNAESFVKIIKEYSRVK